MTTDNNIPSSGYGITRQYKLDSVLDQAVEKIQNLGYAIIDSGYTTEQIVKLSKAFDHTREIYLETYGERRLRKLDEIYTIRSLLTHGGEIFLKLALNENLLGVLKNLIAGKFILNQQNGIINPPKETYNQSAWHRDFPYQHFVSSKPLGINALYCVDDFTLQNGATFVLPASHKSEAFPSEEYIQENALQVVAKAGSFILLDCMVFHAGGYNSTVLERRAVNHVFNIPYFKQQINIPINIKDADLAADAQDILGFKYMEATSIEDYFLSRTKEKY